MATKLIDRTPSAYDLPLLIKHILHTPLRIAPGNEIVYKDIKRYDYATLNKRIGQLANALKELGIKEGDTVGVMDYDSHRYLECFFAIPMMGAVLHTVNWRLSPEQILYTINHTEDDVLLVHSDFLPLVEKFWGGITTVKKLIVLCDEGPVPETSLEISGEYEALIEQSSSSYDFPDFDENSRATVFYTTGTTGSPKGVYFSHRQLVLQTMANATNMAFQSGRAGFCSSDVYMPLTPMFHVHGWTYPYIASLLGCKHVYPGRYIPDAILELIAKEGVTITHCVPTIVQMLLNSPVWDKVDLSGWKLIIGGSALPKGLCAEVLKKGVNIYAGFGMSESCPTLTVTAFKPHMFEWDEDKKTDIRCRTGLPLPLVDLRIVDPEGQEAPHDGVSVGEIVVRAPWLVQGYLKETERSEELWTGGWMHTGDVGWIDEEGYLQITDRIKDVIKTGGEWLSSILIEEILSQHPAVSEAAVVGMPDETWGERPYALVTIKAELAGKVSEEELKSFFKSFVAAGSISKWGVPDRIVMVDAIPKTSVGKLDKKEIRKSVLEQHSPATLPK
jgi:fatty-acyl-CoA synthase